MNDLISRQDAIDAFKKELTVGESKGNYVTICSAISYEGAKQILENLPSAEPRPKGRWIDETFKPWGLVHHPYKCNQCGEHSEMDSDFCPNCGADMRGEKRDDT